MVRIGTSFAALALCVAAACQSPPQTVASQEEVMTASGFQRVPATTPQQQLTLKQLPPHKFSRQTRDGHVAYIYPDPTACVCLYVGDHNAYAAYKKTMLDRKLADDQALTANEMTMNDIDWGPWGPSPLGTW
jgi:hypothetical protein